MVDIIKTTFYISLFFLNIDIKKERIFLASIRYLMNIQSQNTTVASLNQYIGPVYDDLGYDEDPHLHCLEPTQHSWVLDPS